MIESKQSKWRIHYGVGGELIMQGEWTIPSARMEFAAGNCEREPAADSRARVVALVAKLQADHKRILDNIRQIAPSIMDDHQLSELESLQAWMITNGGSDLRRVQEAVYLASQDEIAVFVEQIILTYQRMAGNLVARFQRAADNDKAHVGLHLAEWISDTPARLAFRLHRFGMDISRERIEGKAAYVVNNYSADGALFLFALKGERGDEQGALQPVDQLPRD